ncbi:MULTISPECIES: helix-turn-helix domain-containing protein [unclassified Megasphaera]|uniref:helix-turn-helix domain-containing protein n=1 Tax=unclassified Megasphaera TaxID=2626256 RepID=UPI0025C268B6|nr:helix-turn-helix transcriptional regulator [Megasphaera sp. UBA4233]
MTTVDLDYIKKRREELGITQAQMAKELGLSNPSGYNHYENGNRKFTAALMPIMAKILQCPMEKLYT